MSIDQIERDIESTKTLKQAKVDEKARLAEQMADLKLQDEALQKDIEGFDADIKHLEDAKDSLQAIADRRAASEPESEDQHIGKTIGAYGEEIEAVAPLTSDGQTYTHETESPVSFKSVTGFWR